MENKLRPALVALALTAVSLDVVAANAQAHRKVPAKKPAPVVQAAPTPPPPPAYVVPPSPGTEAGDKAMLASAAYKGGFETAKTAYTELAGEPQLKTFDEKTDVQWLKDAAAKFRDYATQLKELNAANVPVWGNPTTQVAVEDAYDANGKRAFAESQSIIVVTKKVNEIYNEGFKKFLTEADGKLVTKHQDDSALTALLKTSPVIDLESSNYSAANQLSPKIIHANADAAVNQLTIIANYIQMLATPKLPGAHAGFMDKGAKFGISLRDLTAKKGTQPEGPFVNGTWASHVNASTGVISAALDYLAKHVKPVTAKPASPETKPTAYTVYPFGDRLGRTPVSQATLG